MSSRRVLKAAAAIREVVSMAILADLKDPRVRDVTVTHVEVTGDMRQAKVHVSIMGDETRQQLSLRGLQNSAGYLQSKIADRIDTRYTPKLEFLLDQGVKRSIEIAQILQRELAASKPPSSAADEQDADDLDADELDDDDAGSADDDDEATDDDAAHNEDEITAGKLAPELRHAQIEPSDHSGGSV